MFGKIFSSSCSFDFDVLLISVINPVKLLTETLPFLIFNNCSENKSADRSFGKFITNISSQSEFFQTRVYFISRMTANVCRKSTAKRIRAPPIIWPFPRRSFNVRFNASNDLLCAIVHSSDTIKAHRFRIFVIPDRIDMLHVGASLACTFNGTTTTA